MTLGVVYFNMHFSNCEYFIFLIWNLYVIWCCMLSYMYADKVAKSAAMLANTVLRFWNPHKEFPCTWREDFMDSYNWNQNSISLRWVLPNLFFSFRYFSNFWHYCDVIMGAMASQITSLTSVYSTAHSGADKRKHQSSASLAFVRGIHRWLVSSRHKWSVTRKMFPLDDVIMRTIELTVTCMISCSYLTGVTAAAKTIEKY